MPYPTPSAVVALLREVRDFLLLSPRSRLHALVAIGAAADVRLAEDVAPPPVHRGSVRPAPESAA